MYTSLFYKEWIKARKLLLLLLVVFAAAVAYTLLTTIKQFHANPVAFWEFIVENNSIRTGYMRYLPLGAGILLAIVQLTPEMHNRRLKLTLHLPLDESKILCSMSGFGLALLSGLFILSGTALLLGLRIYFCPEIVYSDFIASLPWWMGGFTAYLLTVWICLEPVWKQRIFNAIPALCCISLFYTKALPGAYVPLLPWLTVLMTAGFFFPFYSAIRFKHGVQ
ncbi:MAG: hypothetical protein LBR08_13365 [Bacteroidales bacterium]|jgi:hypothetical protein|nr:hypothetical protein [Bacteroidales bacterium]